MPDVSECIRAQEEKEEEEAKEEKGAGKGAEKREEKDTNNDFRSSAEGNRRRAGILGAGWKQHTRSGRSRRRPSGSVPTATHGRGRTKPSSRRCHRQKWPGRARVPNREDLKGKEGG